MTRTFIAIPIPEAIHRQIDTLNLMMKRSGFQARWVPSENRHLTVAFLGEIPDEGVLPVCHCAEGVASEFPAMTLHLKGVGVFPSLQRPRVVWVGVGGDTELLGNFQKALHLALSRLEGVGFTPESRPFKAHLTVGRMKGSADPKRLWTSLQYHMGFLTPAFAAGQAVIYKSDLKSTGAVYTQMGVAPFMDQMAAGELNATQKEK